MSPSFLPPAATDAKDHAAKPPPHDPIESEAVELRLPKHNHNHHLPQESPGWVVVTVSEVVSDVNEVNVQNSQVELLPLLLRKDQQHVSAASQESIHASHASHVSHASSPRSKHSIAFEEKAIYPTDAAPKFPKYHSLLPHCFTSLPWQYKVLSIVIMLMIPAIIIGAALSLTHGVAAKTPGPIVDVGYSSFQGNALNGINEWLGVRYAAPPTKENRFKAPQPPQSTKKLQQADKVRHNLYT